MRYLEPRLTMRDYRDWSDRDLVLASGPVEGAVRPGVEQRLDAAGLRWIPGYAEARLRLRCLEINGDWDAFFARATAAIPAELPPRDPVPIRTGDPIPLKLAA